MNSEKQSCARESEKGLRIEIPVHITRDRRARKVLVKGEAPKAEEPVSRIARLLALAHKWEEMVRRGDIDYAGIARQYGLSRARVSQICDQALLEPAVQEARLLGHSSAPAPSGRSNTSKR